MFFCLFVLPKRCVVTVVAGERFGYAFSYAATEEEEDGSSFRSGGKTDRRGSFDLVT